MLTKHEDIKNTIMDFYGDLVGTVANNIDDIEIVAMRQGPKLTLEERNCLISTVSKMEIKKALKDIGDLKVPEIDGYGAKFFKTTWRIIKK